MLKIKLLLIILTGVLSIQDCLAEFDPGKAGFSISVNNEIYPYREFAVYVLPQEHLGLCINAVNPDEHEIIAESGELTFIADCRWIWTTPKTAGLTRLTIVNKANKDTISLNAFVMKPYSKIKNGVINNVKLGAYPEPIDNSPLYQKPDGFIEVTAELVDTPVSPHFVLGQFISPLDKQYPKYIVLRERLLLKLEALLEKLNSLGYAAKSLSIIAGYMSPAYNASIAGPLHSRHLYGGAASIIIDTDADGEMDDLDGNGLIEDADAAILFNIINDLYSEPGKEYLQGGLYLYSKNESRGPVIMLDARGYRKRWDNKNNFPDLPVKLKPKHKRLFQK